MQIYWINVMIILIKDIRYIRRTYYKKCLLLLSQQFLNKRGSTALRRIVIRNFSGRCTSSIGRKKLRKNLYSIDRMQFCNSSWHLWHLNQISSSNHYMLSYLWQNRSEVRPIISIAGPYVFFTGTCNWTLTDSLSMYCRTSRVFARKYLRVAANPTYFCKEGLGLH